MIAIPAIEPDFRLRRYFGPLRYRSLGDRGSIARFPGSLGLAVWSFSGSGFWVLWLDGLDYGT